MSGSKPEVFTAQIGAVEEPTPEQQRRARLVVAANAHDAGDCRELLAALGLVDPGFQWVRSLSGHGTHKRRRVEHPQPEPEPRASVIDSVDASIAYYEQTLHMLDQSTTATETERETVRRTIESRQQLKTTLQERT